MLLFTMGSKPPNNDIENLARENARQIFDSVDTNRDGSLDFHELQRAFQTAGIKISDVCIISTIPFSFTS